MVYLTVGKEMVILKYSTCSFLPDHGALLLLSRCKSRRQMKLPHCITPCIDNSILYRRQIQKMSSLLELVYPRSLSFYKIMKAHSRRNSRDGGHDANPLCFLLCGHGRWVFESLCLNMSRLEYESWVRARRPASGGLLARSDEPR